MVPCSLVLAVLGPKLGELLFGRHGYGAGRRPTTTGVVFAIFCLGLLPYMIFQLQLRVFYSVHDSKTPALIGLATMIVNIVANLIALSLFRSELVAALGAGFGVANLVGLVIAWRILSTRLRGLDGFRIGRSLVRMHAATLPAALLAILVGLVTTNAIRRRHHRRRPGGGHVPAVRPSCCGSRNSPALAGPCCPGWADDVSCG